MLVSISFSLRFQFSRVLMLDPRLEISHVRLNLDEITLVTKDIAAAHETFQRTAIEQLQVLNDGFSRLQSVTPENNEQHIKQIFHQVLSTMQNRETWSDESDTTRTRSLDEPARHSQIFTNDVGQGERVTKYSACVVKTSYYWGSPCRTGCICVCHRRYHLKTPQALNRFIGSLFVGYSGLPLSTPPCSEVSCQRRSALTTQITYSFPSWFLRRRISMNLLCTPLDGPMLSLRFPRLVSSTSKIFDYASLGNVAGMKFLFQTGQASPYDVLIESGMSALQYAADRRQIDMCRFLLAMKADPFLEDNAQTSAMDAAWTQIFSNSLTPDTENQMRQLFGDEDCLEKRQFSPVHDIVLGFRRGSVDLKLSASSSFINSVDSNGRTPLSWAASRGDFKVVQSLIRLGANPNIISVSKMSPLHFAMRASNPRCIVPLLAAGGRVDQLTDWMQTPLHHAASYQDSHKYLEPLIDSGANVNALDRDGNSPLGCAALSNRATSTTILLEAGADINSQTPSGWNALLMAVDNNSHAVLEILLKCGADPTLTLRSGDTILHRAAERGDARTMQLLKSARMREIDVTALNGDSRTARELFAKRDHILPEMVESFEALLQSIQHSLSSLDESSCDQEEPDAAFFDAVQYMA